MYDLRENDKIEGWMSLIELLALHSFAGQMDSVVELGSYRGRSTYALSVCKDVTTIDDFSMTGREPLESLNLPVKIIEGKSHEHLKETDMLFIDADHSYEGVKKDIEAWKPYVKKLICGHDYDLEGVRQAVLETLGTPDDVIGSVWIKWI